MNKLVIFNFLFASTLTLHAADDAGTYPRLDVVSSQIISGASVLKTFDGKSFAYKDKELRSALADYGNAEVNTLGKSIQYSNSLGQYKMSWENQDFENGQDLRLNQVAYRKGSGNQNAHIKMVTSTFNGKNLRSVTQCSGAKVNTSSDNELYCATATKKICEKVMTAYNRNDSLRTENKNAYESRKIDKEKVAACVNTLKGYSEVLKAFSVNYEGNNDLKAAREKVVDQDTAEIKKMLSGMKDVTWKPTSINDLKGNSKSFWGLEQDNSAYDALAEKLSGSMRGLKQINDFVDLCAENEKKFVDDSSTASNAAKSRPATAVR